MKREKLLVCIALFFLISIGHSQNTFDIQFPQQDRATKCKQCFNIFKQKPKEVKFSVKLGDDNNLYFIVNNKQWFNTLFKNSGDGIAVDIVSKDRYNCSLLEIDKKQIRGKLLAPVYAGGLKRGIKPYGENNFRVKVGTLPEEFNDKEIEFNILFLSNRNLCMYYTIYDLETYKWNLLDMGMYLDSLTYKNTLNTSNESEEFTLKNKTLQFKIPFEKNKFDYLPEDIKPLYDSLNLTDFTIKKIKINAYSSVEGNLKRNIELQEKRANSIVIALQTFQKPTIVTEVSSSENWVEFFNDISNTKYASLKELSKKEIKSKLVGSVSSELEPYLKNHRKAIIILELEKKDKYKTKSSNELLNLFHNSIAESDIKEALEIQNSIFQKLKETEIDPSFIDKMEVPKQKKYTVLLTKNAVIKYIVKETYLLISYNQLKELEKVFPKDKNIKYNLAVLKFKIWRYKVQKVDENVFKKEILALQNYGVELPLINRMLVNYHIIKSEFYLRNGDYINKDKSVTYIFKNYQKFPLSDSDYLSLTQYLAYYSNNEKAISILEKKVKEIEVNEDLLFYYLNLTIVDKNLTKTSNYKITMLNAVNMNKKRFCKLFNASGKNGGVTFQLLEDDFLRKSYCENCNE